ncbi:calmodulin [Tritrichomonas foetus]|uniref:Calmodulin n=1 Tax=Tritrichomonas foetus TaxID=1144522 RepID=A0A1J4L224_9EUKA|nr:calmodulin [Tritrichomonas foetus]|eukprot:OHT17567.1 calmodulin [Tritrichomonas foetus]
MNDLEALLHEHENQASEDEDEEYNSDQDQYDNQNHDEDDFFDDDDRDEKQIIQEYIEAFEIFDKDRHGYLTAKELLTVLRALGQNPSDQEFQNIISKIDQNHSGTIELNEFIDFMVSQTEEFSPENELRRCFELFEDDATGEISEKMFRTILQAPGKPFTKEEMMFVETHFRNVTKVDDYINVILNDEIRRGKSKK